MATRIAGRRRAARSPAPSPTGRGWTRLKVLAAAGAGVLGAASAAIGVQTWIESRLQPPLTVNVEHQDHGPCFPGWIIPAEPSQLGDVPPVENLDDLEARTRWAQANGGVDAQFTTAEVTVQGTSDRAVILTGITVEVRERAGPLEGIQVAENCGDALWIRYFQVDLDSAAPVIGSSVDDRAEVALEGTEPPDPIDFPYTVTAGDPEVFSILARTETCYCEWTATLHWRDGDEDGATTLSDDGEPFRVSAIGSAQQYGNYAGGALQPLTEP
jgi:hypothetical protein